MKRTCKCVINEETEVKGRYITKHRTYKLLKTSFKKENYLNLPLGKQILFSFSKLRVSNHKLEIELGRYRNIPSKERYCRVCKSNQIEDEFHIYNVC